MPPTPPTASVTATTEKALNAVRAIFDRFFQLAKARDYQGFDATLMSKLELESAHPAGRSVFRLKIGEELGNMNGVLHGGATALIFDMCTTTALGPVAKKGEWEYLGGVTRTLSISYLRAVPVGTTVRVRSEVLQKGRTMALIRGVMVDAGTSREAMGEGGVEGDGDGDEMVYATVDHHKVNVTVGAGAGVGVGGDEDGGKARL